MLYLSAFSPAAASFDASRVSFTIKVHDVQSDLSILSVTVMPGERLNIKTAASANTKTGDLEATDDGWQWRAPSLPGLYTIRFTKGAANSQLNIFVLTPWDATAGDTLNGYKIGRYADKPYRNLSTYNPPTGFIKADKSLLKTRVSPHFTLGQFICKQKFVQGYTYLLAQPAELLKLERLLEAVNRRGLKVETLHVMSGFRTPYYNRSIGNKTTSSRHLFGGAADVFVDADGNGRMDDLNGDGLINKNDAQLLADIAKGIAKSDPISWPAGGIGVYPENSIRGPFVHIDIRGFKAHW